MPTTFTPATLAPGPPTPPGDRPQGFIRWLCLTSTSARDETQGQEASIGRGQLHGAEKAEGATHPRRGPPHPSRRRAQACLHKLLHHEMQRRNLRRAKSGDMELQEAQGEAAREEEQDPKSKGWSRLLNPYCLLPCCCLLAFLLMMDVYAATFRKLEDARQHPTPTQLRQEVVAAATLVVTAAWCLSVLPTPAASIALEVLLLMLLTLTNASLVLLTRTILAVHEPLRYCCCGWLAGILAPFCLIVLVVYCIPWT